MGHRVHFTDMEDEYKASGKGTHQTHPGFSSARLRLLPLHPVTHPRCPPTQSTRKLGTTTTCRPSTWTLHLHLDRKWHRSRGLTPTLCVAFTEWTSSPGAQTTDLAVTSGHACLWNGY